MKKLNDPGLFCTIKTYLRFYLPEIRAKSSNTVKAYRDTLNQRLSCIRSFYKYLVGDNIELAEMYSHIQQIAKIPIPNKILCSMLAIENIQLILRLPDTTQKSGIRDQFYFALLYDTGCRNQEILNLHLCDIHIDRNEKGAVHIIGKGNKFRATPISKDVIHMYQKYIKFFHSASDKEQYLFYTVRKGIATRMSDDNVARFMKKYELMAKKVNSNIPHLHPHLFRHARAMHLYQAGMPLPLISEWLGHAQLETTLIYANADLTMKRAAVEKISTSKNSVFNNNPFVYQNDEEVIKRLYGLTN